MKNEPSLVDTDLCVMCGMCTPHCPTYHIYKTETESPRGRIALMQALDNGNIELTQNVADHLNHCLGCLACERICPSQVPFGKLMDAGRQRFSTNKHGYSHKLLFKLSRHKQGLDYYRNPIQLLNQSRLIKLLPQGSKTRSLIEQAQASQLDCFYPARNTKKGTVGLFKGCMGQTFDADTLCDAIKLLTHLGFDVHVPKSQYCCGALHQHNGDMQSAEKLATQNRQLFQQYELDHIVYTASGCGSQIINTEFSAPVADLASFILEQLSNHSLAFKPLHKHAIIHQACRGKNELGLVQVNQQLIELIPDINIQQIHHADLCCGAGGSNQLDYPELANELLSIKLDELKAAQPDYLVSDNLGCSMHFKAGLKLSRLNIEVIHPVTLLARQMI